MLQVQPPQFKEPDQQQLPLRFLLLHQDPLPFFKKKKKGAIVH